MLQVNNLSKFYGPQAILEDVSFVISRGERVGLVGLNGCGKSTLFRLIAGVERPDTGQVNLDPAATMGYLPQGSASPPDRTVAEEVRSGIEGLDAARRQMEELTSRMGEVGGEAQTKLLAAYGEAQARFEALGGYTLDHRTAAVLSGLGLASIPLDTPLAQLSGGQRARIGLARLLVAEPTLLLFDEPTNHLDIETLEWLEQFLAGYPGAALIVSHDRVFLDQTVSRILELEATTHQMAQYAGNYSDYVALKALGLEKQWSAWKDQQAETRRLQADIRRTYAQAQHNERATIDSSARRLAKKVAKKAKARERRLERYLESQERVEKPGQRWGLKLEFGEMPRGGQLVVTLEGVGQAFGARSLFRGVNLTLKHGERIALLGPNGAGKTTLLRIIAGELAPSEGRVRVGANVHLGYMPQQQENLNPEATPLSLIRGLAPLSETEARSLLHYFLFGGDEVFVPCGSLSYGERARLLLAQMVVAGKNCLLLDEPINHLDIPSRERFKGALDAFPGTIVAAVHDRAFIDHFAGGIWSLEGGGVRRYFERGEVGKGR